MSQAVIEAVDLRKTFPGNVVAVHGLDLAVPEGCVYGLIGRNGAGKTTTIRLLMGLLHADGGSARILGRNLWTAPREHRARIAYVSQTQQLHGWMTLAELSHYVAQFYPQWDQRLAAQLTDRFGLPSHTQVGLLSGGEQRKVALLLAVAACPEVLLLDEPAAGLDPIARRELIEVLVDALAQRPLTVLFSTHILADLERLADQVGMMDRGRMISSERLDVIQSQTKRVQVIFPGTAPPPDFRVPGTLRSYAEGPVVTAIVRLEDEAQLTPVRNLSDVRVNVYPLGLEDVFVELFGPAPLDVPAEAVGEYQ